jgi:hypothetical protein
METVKIVLRYTDGRVLKGFTRRLFPNRDRIDFFPAGKSDDSPTEVSLSDLKAVFVVRDWVGNSAYEERKAFAPGQRAFGRKVEITFEDGEKLVGSTLGYDLRRMGFFFVPADPRSNNIRAFVVSSAIKKVLPLS